MSTIIIHQEIVSGIVYILKIAPLEPNGTMTGKSTLCTSSREIQTTYGPASCLESATF